MGALNGTSDSQQRRAPRGHEPSVGQLVEYVAQDDPEGETWHGQPGTVVDLLAEVDEVIVQFFAGPTLSMPPAAVSPLSEQAWSARAERMRASRHPVRDHDIRLGVCGVVLGDG